MQYAPDSVKIEAFHALFTQVAAELGGFDYVPHPWQYEGTPHSVTGHLFSKAETATFRVHLSLSTYAPTLRAELSGVYPQTSKGTRYQADGAPRIGFVITRDAKSIAADMRRRFVSNYKTYHAKALKMVQEWEQAENQQAFIKSQMIAAGFAFTNYEFQGYRQHPTADCTVYGRTVDMKLRDILPEQAAQIINFLRPAA